VCPSDFKFIAVGLTAVAVAAGRPQRSGHRWVMKECAVMGQDEVLDRMDAVEAVQEINFV